MENLETQNETQEVEDTRDIVARELDKLEAAETTAQEAPEAVKTGRARDEHGKFTKAAQEPEKVEPEPVEEKTEEVTDKPARNPWSSWKKEAQTALSALDPTVQQMIQERESQFHKGLDQYRTDAVYGKTMKSALQPHMEYLTSLGVTPEAAIPRLIATEKIMRTGSQQEKSQMFMQLAHDYGIDLNNLAQTPFNAVEYQLRQQLAALQQQVGDISQSRQMADEASLSSTIEGFASEHEHFDALRETMADLLDMGKAKDLDDAYEKALRLNDDLWNQHIANQQANSERAKLEQANHAAKQAKAAAVSVKGSPTGTTKGPEPKSTEDAVRQAMAALGL